MVAVLITCVRKFCREYILVWKHLCEWNMMRENKVIIVDIYFLFEDMSYLWICGMWQPVLFTSKGRVANQLLLCILLFCSFQSVGAIHGVEPKSCDRSYVHSCIPWILEDLSNDPWIGTANDFDCSLLWLSVHVGKCSIGRPWFSWGLVGLVSLPLHL